MSVVHPKPGAMLLDRATIAKMDAEDLAVVLEVARGHDRDRRDAQRTIQRGLDQGVLGLGRHLEIRLASEMRGEEWTGRADEPPESGSENEKMNVRTLLSHEPRLGDNPSLTPQPSIETIVRLHFDRLFGEGQGAIVADMYLDRIREAAAAPTPQEAGATAPEGPAPKDGPIDPEIARAFVANMVRTAVIADRRPQTRLQIVRMISEGISDGSIFDADAELCRHFTQGGLLGDQEELVAFVTLLVDERVLDAYGDGYVARSTAAADGKTEAPGGKESTAEAPKATATEKPAETAAAPKPERKDPPFSLGTILSEIGIDLKVGNIDIVSGVEKASRTGNAAPLVAGLASILLGAVATAEAKKPE